MKRIPTLDGWRAVAVLAVIAFHAGYFNHVDLSRGAIGVDIFFALSGLLITSQLLENPDLKAFYIRRAFRILPPAVLYLVVIYHFTTADDLVRCLLIVRNFVHGPVCTEHYWSLSLEEQFYLVWPVAVLVMGKRARGVALAAVVAVTAWRAFVLGNVDVPTVHRTDLRCDGLLWGCISAFAYRMGNLRIGRVLPVIAFVLAVGSFGVVSLMPVVPFLLSVAILGTAQEPTSLLARILEWSPLVWIGKRSYGIYIWQMFALMLNVPWSVKVVVLFGWPALLYELYEMPIRQLGRRLSRRRLDQEQILYGGEVALKAGVR